MSFNFRNREKIAPVLLPKTETRERIAIPDLKPEISFSSSSGSHFWYADGCDSLISATE